MRPRFATLLLLPLAAACGATNVSPRLAPVLLPMSENSVALETCRAEATRMVQFRDRGQLMRTDEVESGRGTFSSVPFSRVETERMGQQITRDRLIADCLRGADRAAPAATQGAGNVAPPAAGRAIAPPGLR